MNIVDSSGWLEFFSDGPNAQFFAAAVKDEKNLVVPTVSIYEVFKRLLLQRGESEALMAIAHMQQGMVVEMDATIALDAAKVSQETGLPMADSIILATARAYSATLWTQDAHFEGMRGVQYVPKD